MNIAMSLFLLFVSISYVFFWRMYTALRNRKIELERQVQEKAELLTYSVINERKATEQVALANGSKKQLLNIINHGVRTPLNGILGMVSLLDETSLTPEQKEYNATILNCSENLLTTINDIFLGDVLAHAKVEADKGNLEQKNFDLRNSIEEVFDVFASQTARVNLELVYHVDHGVPSMIIGDSLRLRQVLMNLVENAITFTREGEIFVKVYVREENGNALELGFEVHDNGLGMPHDKIKLLSMESPSSAGEIAKQSNDGLLISKRLIALMGGRLEIESIKGKGTIAKFNLQILRGDHAHQADQDMTAVHGRRILVVEDNATLRNALAAEITHWNLVPILASSGNEALEILAGESTIDLVLVEMQMPAMDGLMLSQSIREKHPSLPIILLSVASDSASKNHPELFNAVIMKPLRYHVLSQYILSGLMHKEQGPSKELNSSIQKLSSDFAQRYPLKILIAEDNRVNQKLAMKVLTKLGYNPDIAQDGKEVLEEVSKVNYDLILMDVQMPEMDGLEATRMVRLCLSVQPIIIAMTANAMQGDREECMQAGMDDYISKPVHLEELVIMLEKWALKVKEKQ